MIKASNIDETDKTNKEKMRKMSDGNVSGPVNLMDVDLQGSNARLNPLTGLAVGFQVAAWRASERSSGLIQGDLQKEG